MTLQVAMIGSDGWVLASDRRLSEVEPVITRSGEVETDTYLSDLPIGGKKKPRGKVAYYEKGDLIWAVSDEVQISGQAGSLIEKRPETDFRPDRRKDTLRDIADHLLYTDIYARLFAGGKIGSLLLVFCSQPVELWTISVPGAPVPCGDIAFGGGGNRAKYLVERFYRPKSRSERRPVADLKFLAAYTILEGALLNPSWVEGLELWWSENGKVQWVDDPNDPALKAIRKRAEGFRADMRKELLAPVKVK